VNKIIAAALGALAVSACTPAEIAWWTSRVDQAESQGRRCPDLAPLMEVTGLPVVFDALAWRESKCHPDVVNRSTGAAGIWQIMPQWLGWGLCDAQIACSAGALVDPLTNAKAARFVFDHQGITAWAPSGAIDTAASTNDS
jgi:hypothetical protein